MGNSWLEHTAVDDVLLGTGEGGEALEALEALGEAQYTGCYWFVEEKGCDKVRSQLYFSQIKWFYRKKKTQKNT